MFDQRPTDVSRTSHHLFPGTSCNWILQTSRGCHHLDFLNICSSCKKQRQICNTRTIISEIIISIISIFVLPTWESPEGRLLFSDVRTFRGLSGDVTGSLGCHLPDPGGCFLGVFLLDYNVYHLNIVANHVLFYSFKVLIDRFNNAAPSG